ncbi:MAG: hypothetical protein ACR2H1_00725 [Limisphaerales bacterium]
MRSRDDGGRKDVSTAGVRLREASRGVGVGGMNTTECRIGGGLPGDAKQADD